jgi:hypothetical protein
MYLPKEIKNAKVLISVKTYPLPSNKYEELVCTAGFLEDGRWIRIYPVPFRSLPQDKKFEKYHWIELDLIRNDKDFRPESYRPKDNIKLLTKVDTLKGWEKRKEIVLKNVFYSFNELIELSKGDQKKSLAVLKPKEIIDFVIEKDTRDWKEQWKAHLDQFSLFDVNTEGKNIPRQVASKVPYKYSYKFLSKGDEKPRTLMIEDWEIGALYWHCLKQTGDEQEASKKVRQKYFDEFVQKKDLYFFVGTTLKYHLMNAPNPFVIIGLFYPPKTSLSQGELF